ncbi:MAG: hypothetical protein JKY65_17525 [Planctomycetes bacterium]|nr:hypothetical protein [Planctomycetota bacterium]
MSPGRPPEDDDRLRFPFGHSEEGPLERFDDEDLPASESPTQHTGDALPQQSPAVGWSGMGAADSHDPLDLGSLPLDSFEGMAAYPGGFGSLDSSADHDFSRYAPGDDPSGDLPAFESEEGAPLLRPEQVQDSWDSDVGESVIDDSELGVVPDFGAKPSQKPRQQQRPAKVPQQQRPAQPPQQQRPAKVPGKGGQWDTLADPESGGGWESEEGISTLRPSPGRGGSGRSAPRGRHPSSGMVPIGSDRLPAGTNPFELRSDPLEESGPFELNDQAKARREESEWGEPLTSAEGTLPPSYNRGPDPPGPTEATLPPSYNRGSDPPGPAEATLPPSYNRGSGPPGPTEATLPPSYGRGSDPPGPAEATLPLPYTGADSSEETKDRDRDAPSEGGGVKSSGWRAEPSGEWDESRPTGVAPGVAWTEPSSEWGVDSLAGTQSADEVSESDESSWEAPRGWGGLSSATYARPDLGLPAPGTVPGAPPPPAPLTARKRALPGQNDPTPAPTYDDSDFGVAGGTGSGAAERAPDEPAAAATQTSAWANARPDRTLEIDPEQPPERSLGERSQLDESQETPIVFATGAVNSGILQTDEELIELPPSEASLAHSNRLPQPPRRPPGSRGVPPGGRRALGDESDESFNLDAPSESKWEVFQSEGTYGLEEISAEGAPGRAMPPEKWDSVPSKDPREPLRTGPAASELRGPTIALDDSLDSHSLLLAELGASAGILSDHDLDDESHLQDVSPFASASDQGLVPVDESWEGLALSQDEPPQSVAERVGGLWEGGVLWGLLSVGAALLGPLLIWVAWSYFGLPGPERRWHAWHPYLNANNFLGLLAGVASAVLVFSNLFYIVRRRLNWFRQLSMRTSLNTHMLFGITAGSLALLHSGLEASNIPARICAFAMAFAIASGLFGRYVLAHVPRRQEGDLASRAQLATLLAQLRGDLRRQLVPYPQLREAALTALSEVETSKPKRGFAMVWDLFLGDVTQRRRELSLGNRFRDLLDAEVSHDGELEGLLNETLELIHLHGRVNRRLSHFEGIRDLMDSWRGLHMILALIMVGALLVHVTIGFLYGNLEWGPPNPDRVGERAPQEPGGDK